MNAEASLPKRRSLPWALVPVALLLASALGMGSMAFVAVHDPHFATEPDYYQKAVRWDQSQTQAATNQRLGYAVELPAVVRFDARGQAMVELSIRDRFGQPMTGVSLTANAFANAYSGKVVRLGFEEQAPGRYRARLTASHAGQWVFEVVGTSGGERFTAELRADLAAGGPA